MWSLLCKPSQVLSFWRLSCLCLPCQHRIPWVTDVRQHTWVYVGPGLQMSPPHMAQCDPGLQMSPPHMALCDPELQMSPHRFIQVLRFKLIFWCFCANTLPTFLISPISSLENKNNKKTRISHWDLGSPEDEVSWPANTEDPPVPCSLALK